MGDFWNGLTGVIKVLIIAGAAVVITCTLCTCSLLGATI